LLRTTAAENRRTYKQEYRLPETAYEGVLILRGDEHEIQSCYVCTLRHSRSFVSRPRTNNFSTEQQAQQHCPNDTVVWVNLPTGVYHFKGERWYGATKRGAFVCQKEADQAGDRATRNGQ